MTTPPDRIGRITAAAISLALAGPSRADTPPCDLPVEAEAGPVEKGSVSALVRVRGDARPRFEPSAGKVMRPGPWSSGEWQAQWVLSPAEGASPALLAVFSGDRCGWVAFPPATAVPATRGAGPGRAVPAARVLHLVLLRDAEPGKLQVAVFAASDGAPWSGAPPTLSATAGGLGPLEAAGPGAWRASWDTTAVDAGGVRITASAGGLRVHRALAELPGPPSRLEVKTDRARAQAGDEAPVEVGLAVLDAAGRPTASDPPALEDDLGAAGQVEELERGSWRAFLLVPAAFSGRRVLRVEARLGALRGTAELELVGGPATTLQAVADLTPRRGSGALVGEVVAMAFDAYGNPVPVPGLEASAARGTLGAPVERDGRIALAYRQELASGEPGEDAITLKAGELTRVLPLRGSLLPPRLSVALRGGAARTGSVGAHAGAALLAWWDWSGEHVGLGLDLGGWALAERGTASVGSARVAWRSGTRLAAASLVLTWRARPARRVFLAATAGGGAGWLEYRAELAGQRPLTEGRWGGLATAALAAGLRAWRGGPFLELRGVWLPRTGLASLPGSYTGLSLALGYWFDAG